MEAIQLYSAMKLRRVGFVTACAWWASFRRIVWPDLNIIHFFESFSSRHCIWLMPHAWDTRNIDASNIWRHLIINYFHWLAICLHAAAFSFKARYISHNIFFLSSVANLWQGDDWEILRFDATKLYIADKVNRSIISFILSQYFSSRNSGSNVVFMYSCLIYYIKALLTFLFKTLSIDYYLY